MKKAFTFLFLILISICLMFPIGIANANTKTPHIIIEGDVYIQDLDGKNLFLLPNSYYAKINNIDENFYYIIFNGVNGKVSKKLVSTTGYHSASPTTSKSIAISNDYMEFNGINLKKEPNVDSESVFNMPISAAFTFLGEYPTAQGNWYYVKFEQHYGYIRSDRTTMPEITIETFFPEQEETNNPKEPEKDNNVVDFFKNGNELKIIIIIGVMIPSILMILLLFKPSAKRYKRERIDDD